MAVVVEVSVWGQLEKMVGGCLAWHSGEGTVEVGLGEVAMMAGGSWGAVDFG